MCSPCVRATFQTKSKENKEITRVYDKQGQCKQGQNGNYETPLVSDVLVQENKQRDMGNKEKTRLLAEKRIIQQRKKESPEFAQC